MGYLTNAEMLTQVQTGLGGRTDANVLAVQALNISQEKIANYPYEELNQNPVDITLTASTAAQAVSEIITALISQDSIASHATVKDIIGMSVIDGTNQYPIIGLSITRWEKEIPGHADADRETRPVWYTRYNKDTFLTYPTPDSAYTVRVVCSLWPTPILHTAGVITVGSTPGKDAATSSLENKDGAIIAYALHWIYQIQGNVKKASAFYGVYKDQMNDLKKNKQPDVAPGKPVGNPRAQIDNQQSSSPSAGASAGTSSWDASYNSTPWW